MGTACRELIELELKMKNTYGNLHRAFRQITTEASNIEQYVVQAQQALPSLEEGLILRTLEALLRASSCMEDTAKQRELGQAKLNYLEALKQLQGVYQRIKEKDNEMRAVLRVELSQWIIGDGDLCSHVSAWAQVGREMERVLRKNSSRLACEHAICCWLASFSEYAVYAHPDGLHWTSKRYHEPNPNSPTFVKPQPQSADPPAQGMPSVLNSHDHHRPHDEAHRNHQSPDGVNLRTGTTHRILGSMSD